MRISLSQSNRWIAVTSKYSRHTSPARASYSAGIFATYFFPYKRKTKASRLRAAPPQESSSPRNPPRRLHIPVPPQDVFRAYAKVTLSFRAAYPRCILPARHHAVLPDQKCRSLLPGNHLCLEKVHGRRSDESCDKPVDRLCHRGTPVYPPAAFFHPASPQSVCQASWSPSDRA